MADDIYLQMQKLNNATQIKLQKMSDAATAKTFKYNQKEAQASRDWQKMMSDTSHQREVKDLKKAGLNPVLSVNQGAASYTTSSASGEAENPSSGVAQLAASEMSSMAGLKQSEIQAAATKHAAATSAAAQKAAAQQAAAAQRYAADMAYRTQQEKNANELQKIEAQKKWDYKIAVEKPATSLWSFLDKAVSKTDYYEIFGSSNVSKIINTVASFINDPISFFHNRGSINQNNFSLNKSGQNMIDARLKKMNIDATNYSRNLFVKAFVFQNSQAVKQIVNIAKSSRPTRSPRTGRPERAYW